MKKIYSIAIFTAAILSFASCQKEAPVSETRQPAIRTLTATFENAETKTTLGENDKPLWEVNDVIRLLDGASYQDITLTAEMISGGSVTLTTDLTGEDVYAVYPASATEMTSCSGSVTFTIPAKQDGTFASANICVAKKDDDDKLMFRNATAVFEFSQTAATTKVLSIKVEATNAIVGPMSVSFNDDGTLDTPTTSSLTDKIIRVKSAGAKDKYYIAAAPVTTGKIEFEYQQAVKVATVTTEAGKALAINKIYTCPSMDVETYEVKRGSINGHDYVQIGSLKWATMNIGATAVTGESSYGEYFMWGAVEKAYTGLSGSTFTFGDKPSSYTNSTWAKTKGFAWENCDFSDGVFDNSNKAVFTKYTSVNDYAKNGTADGKTILEAADDVATHIWGSTWRMPTGDNGEFNALRKTTYWNWEDGGYYVYDPVDGDEGGLNGKKAEPYTYTSATGTYVKANALLFFPAAGYGNGNSRSSAGSQGHYWSSTLCSSNPSYAAGPYFESGSVNSQNINPRCYGRPVRPVSD